MTPVAFGLALNRATPRRYVGMAASLHQRRELVLMCGRLLRSQAIRHRARYRMRSRHMEEAAGSTAGEMVGEVDA